MQKKIAIVCLCLMLFICSSSCSNAGNSSSTSGYSTVITVAARDGSHADIINAVKGDFEATNNCVVNVLPLSAEDIHEKAIKDSSKIEGTLDVIMIDDPLMPEYIEKGVLRNLTQLGYNDDDDFVEKSRLLGKDPYPLGATYALPFSGNVQLVFYNSEVLGSDPDLSNWDSILQLCLNAQSEGKNGYAIRGQTGNPIVSDFLPILWAFGGDIFDENNYVVLDSSASRKALQFYYDLYKTGENYEKDTLVKAVSEGDAAIALGWPSWFISGSGSLAQYSPIPGKENASSQPLATGEIGNWLLGITANSVNPDLSLKLIEYLTSSDTQRKAIDYGGIPTRKSIFRDPEIVKKYPHFDVIYAGTNNSRVRPRTTKWSRIEELLGAELLKCINDEQTVDETITRAHNAILTLAEE